MKYGLNDKPTLGPLLMYGLQWWIVSVPCVIILGIVVAKIHFTQAAEQVFYLQKIFGLMGAFLIIQMLWGHRLPLIAGPASVLLIGVLAALSSGIEAIYTAILVGGGVVAVLAFSGLLAKLQPIFTSRIVVVILCLIAFTLAPVILRLVFPAGGAVLFDFFFALLLVLFMIVANNILKGIWKSTAVVIALLAGSLVYFFCEGFPQAGQLETAAGTEALPFFLYPLDFDIGAVLAFLFCFMALIINELGSIQAVGHMIGADNLGQRTTRGVGIVGLSNMFSGMLGVVGPVDYSMSPGIIAATGCASRYTLIPAGIGLLLCAFFPAFIHFLNTIPGVVMGAVLLYLMASQLSAGLQMLTRENAIPDFNSGLIIGFPLMVALLLSFAPENVLAQIPPLIRPIVGNGFVMGVISVLVLEHIIFRKKRKCADGQDSIL